MTTTIVLEVTARSSDWIDDLFNRINEQKWRWRYHQERESGAEPWIDLGGEG